MGRAVRGLAGTGRRPQPALPATTFGSADPVQCPRRASQWLGRRDHGASAARMLCSGTLTASDRRDAGQARGRPRGCPHPGPDSGCRAAPASVMRSNSNDMLRSICSSAIVFSVFCCASMLMPQCARCSACRTPGAGRGSELRHVPLTCRLTKPSTQASNLPMLSNLEHCR